MFTFNPGANLITIDPSAVQPNGILVIDAVKDVYNEARKWEASSEGIVFDEVVASTGGVVLPSGIRTEVHVILNGAWRIQPPDNAQSIEVFGNLHRHDNSDPFAPNTTGNLLPIKETKRQGRTQRVVLHYTAISLVSLALVILALWALCDPINFEPYATFLVVAATLVQLIRNGKPT